MEKRPDLSSESQGSTFNSPFEKMPHILDLPKDKIKQIFKKQLPDLIRNKSSHYVNAALQMYNSPLKFNDNTLVFRIELDNKKTKLLPYIAMLAIFFYHMKVLKIFIHFDISTDSPVIEEIPEKILNHFTHGAQIRTIRLIGRHWESDTIYQIYKVLINQRKSISQLNLDRFGSMTVSKILKESQSLKIRCLKLNEIAFDEEISKSLLLLQLQDLSEFHLDAAYYEQAPDDENSMINSVLQKMVNLDTLCLTVRSIDLNKFVESVSKMKYLDRLNLDPKQRSNKFSQSHLRKLLENNIFLSTLRLNPDALFFRASYLYRLIRQRKRIQESQMNTIMALQSVEGEIPLPLYMISNIIENQKYIILS